jgi:hypothetical protein
MANGKKARCFSASRNVAYRPEADILIAWANVRFRGQSGHDSNLAKCPLLTHLRHCWNKLAGLHNSAHSM